jgi:hypothetical protein
MEEVLVSSLAQTDAVAKLLIEKGLITREEFTEKISEERAVYQRMLHKVEVCNENRISIFEFGCLAVGRLSASDTRLETD